MINLPGVLGGEVGVFEPEKSASERMFLPSLVHMN